MRSRAGRTWFLEAVWPKLLNLQCPLFLRTVWPKIFFLQISPRLKSRNLTFCSRIPTQRVKSSSKIVANHHFLVFSEEGGHCTPRLGPWNFVKETSTPSNSLIPSFLCLFTGFIDKMLTLIRHRLFHKNLLANPCNLVPSFGQIIEIFKED